MEQLGRDSQGHPANPDAVKGHEGLNAVDNEIHVVALDMTKNNM
jgi:hypothetical protein